MNILCELRHCPVLWLAAQGRKQAGEALSYAISGKRIPSIDPLKTADRER
jgi:hypothetical protein